MHIRKRSDEEAYLSNLEDSCADPGGKGGSGFVGLKWFSSYYDT
jgi:hypothetical protein